MSSKSELWAAKCGILWFHRRELREALKEARKHVEHDYVLRRIDSALAMADMSDEEIREQAQELLRETEQRTTHEDKESIREEMDNE